MRWQDAGIPAEDIELALSTFGDIPSLDAKLCDLPRHMVGPVYRWVLHGNPPGNFLVSVLLNNLREAVSYADPLNKAAIVEWVDLLSYLPVKCFGSAAKIDDWQHQGGLLGPVKKNLKEQEAKA